MKIHGPVKSQAEAESRTARPSIRRNRLVWLVFFTSIIFGFAINYLSGELVPLGIKEELSKIATEHGFAIFEHDFRLRHAFTRTPTYLARKVRGNNFPTIAIDIKFVDVQKLEAKRREALEANRLVTGEDDFVPASIRTDNGTLKAKVRLKGDYVDHLDSSKWSMRVEIKGDDHLFGLRRFSIQHPKTRGFQGELLFHETFKKFDIITPRYFFVNVIVNGDDLGIMNLEEHFSKELLERSGRKESVIIKLDESLFWSVKTFENSTPFLVNPFLLYQNAVVDTFQAGMISRSPTLTRDYDVAVGLMRGFTTGRLSASEAFDADLLGKYLAVTDYWGGWHEIRWNNLRFYFNPLTLRLEPVAFDGNLHTRIPVDRGVVGEPIVKKMLDDPHVRDAYQRAYDLLVTQTLDGSLIEELKALEKPVLKELQSEFFMLESFDFPDLIERAKQDITKVGADGWLQPKDDFNQIPIFAHAYLVMNESETYLELLNALPLEVEVRSIYWKDSAGNETSFRPDKSMVYPFKLPETKINGSPYSFRIPFALPASFLSNELVVVFGIEGYNKADEIRTYTARKMAAPLEKNPMPNADIGETLVRHEFLSLHEDGRTVVVSPGRWQVSGTIIIPTGFVLKIDAGTTLQFEDDACLLVYGSTIFDGRADAKIILEGKPNGDGESGSWQGLVVHGAEDRSTWSHVVIRNTSGVEWPKWSLTGGTTFYRSDVNINDSIISETTAEDALNIIHSDFRIEGIQVMNTASDAIDADFATGTIIGGQFEEIGTLGGGDAIDVSGSEVTIDGTMFNRVYDKAISVGEGSQLSARNVTIVNVSVGLASKDGSRSNMYNSTITHAKYAGLMAYSKKAEYGSASLTTDGVRINHSGTVAQVQIGNSLVIDSVQSPGQNIDVEALYESVMRPGIEK